MKNAKVPNGIAADEIHLWHGDRDDSGQFLKEVLAHYVPPHFRIERESGGKPRLQAPFTSLQFNLAHCGIRCVVAVTLGRPVGVDIESVQAGPELPAVAGEIFSESEKKSMDAWPEEEWNRKFLRHWTLKESYSKAVGMGLRLPLNQCAFKIEGGVHAHFGPGLKDSPDQWNFKLLESDQTVTALCVRNENHDRLQLIIRS